MNASVKTEPQGIGGTLRAIREERGVSQKALMIRTGIAQKTISRIENGLDIPKITTVIRIANALDMKVVLMDSGDKEAEVSLEEADAPLEDLS